MSDSAIYSIALCDHVSQKTYTSGIVCVCVCVCVCVGKWVGVRVRLCHLFKFRTDQFYQTSYATGVYSTFFLIP
jgi:hypothetical protein